VLRILPCLKQYPHPPAVSSSPGKKVDLSMEPVIMQGSLIIFRQVNNASPAPGEPENDKIDVDVRTGKSRGGCNNLNIHHEPTMNTKRALVRLNVISKGKHRGTRRRTNPHPPSVPTDSTGGSTCQPLSARQHLTSGVAYRPVFPPTDSGTRNWARRSAFLGRDLTNDQ